MWVAEGGAEGIRHNGEDEEETGVAEAEATHLCPAMGRYLVGQGNLSLYPDFHWPPLSRRLKQTEKCLGWSSLRRDLHKPRRWLSGQGTARHFAFKKIVSKISPDQLWAWRGFWWPKPLSTISRGIHFNIVFSCHQSILFLFVATYMTQLFSSAVLPNVAKLSLVVFLYSTWVYRSEENSKKHSHIFSPIKIKSSCERSRLHCFHKVAHHQTENLFAGCGQLSECPRSIQRLIFFLLHYKPTYTAPASMCLINRMLKTSPPSTPMSSQLQRWLAGSKLERQRWER